MCVIVLCLFWKDTHTPTEARTSLHLVSLLHTITHAHIHTENNATATAATPTLPPKPIPVISADFTEPTSECEKAVDAALALQGRGDIGFFELWTEGEPLGNPLHRQRGASYWGGGRWMERACVCVCVYEREGPCLHPSIYVSGGCHLFSASSLSFKHPHTRACARHTHI